MIKQIFPKYSKKFIKDVPISSILFFLMRILFLKFYKNFISKCKFKDLYVQPEYRSRGVGTKVHLCTSYTIVYEYWTQINRFTFKEIRRIDLVI